MSGIINISENTYSAAAAETASTQERGAQEAIVADVSAITGTTVSITCDNVSTIKGALVQSVDSGNNIGTVDADVSFSGNTLTVADGATFDLSAEDTLFILVWGV